ncbi:MAG TPA: T9SS type A sorting domain-containing protein [Flavobacterium sp.]|nr:T9SS type A sorting domain-containing protein [Flavobacterium sp.]
MKKITLILALFFIALQGQSQVLLSENFDTALNWTPARTAGSSTNVGWSRQTIGTAPSCTPFAGAGMARFYSYNIAAANAFRLTSPAINFTGANYRVKFKMYRDGGYASDTDRLNVIVNTAANTTGGTNLGTIYRSTGLAPAVSADGWYSYSFDLPAGLTGTRYISFLGISGYGNNVYIDEVSVVQIQADDAEITAVNLNAITATVGNTNITGTIKNVGLNVLNNVDINWQADSGAIHTQSLTGLNLAPGQTYNYTHADQWNATPGLYAIKVWLSADNDLTNNELIKTVSVASGSVTRFPLYEKFSSSTCAPCASFNGTYFNPFYTTNHDDFALINYQVNWPGAGDPYYTAEVGTRVAYYGVSGAPTLFVDAKDGTNFDAALLASDLAFAETNPAYFLLNARKELSFDTMNIEVDVTPFLTGTYKVQVAVIEKITTGNIATNGETQFKNVMMKMVPDAGGTIINCVHDVAIPTITLQADLSAVNNIEDLGDLAVVVFIQSTSGKSVMQAAYASELLANNQFESASKIKLYPNPSTGIVRISTETPVDVVISDISGKMVYSMKQVTKDTAMNLSALQKGIYFAKMNDGNSEQTIKVILK